MITVESEELQVLYRVQRTRGLYSKYEKWGARDLSGEVTARPRTVQAPQGVESPKVVRNRHAESRGRSRALDLNPAPDRSSEVRALDAAGET